MKIRPAQATLNDIRNGAAMDELAEHIHQAIAAVRMHNKPAEIRLTIGIAPFKQNSQLVQPPVVFTGEVTSKLPKIEPQGTIMFVDDDGNPTRVNQREPELGLSIAQPPKESSNA